MDTLKGTFKHIKASEDLKSEITPNPLKQHFLQFPPFFCFLVSLFTLYRLLHGEHTVHIIAAVYHAVVMGVVLILYSLWIGV